LALAFALVIYWPSFKGQFHLDDLEGIVSNRYIRIIDLKPGSLFRTAFQDRLQNRPLTNLSFALNYYLNQMNPLGFHIFNFCILVLTAAGIFLLFRKLLIHLDFDRDRSATAALAIAFVWLCHPLNTQAISYIVQRHTSMAGAFSIWSLYFFHLGMEKKRQGLTFFGVSVLSCLCALLSKESSFTLPALIFAYKIYFFDDLEPGWLKRNRRWLFVLAAFYFLAAAIILRPEMWKSMFNFRDISFTAGQKLGSGPRALVWYFFIILFPFPQFLSLIHDFPASINILNPPATVISILLVFAIIFLAIWRARRWRIFSFAALWYLGVLLVESMPLPIDIVNEHRLYLASLSIIGPAVAWPILKLRRMKPVLIGSMIVALFFGFFSWRRNLVWRREPSLWKDVLHKSPMVSLPWSNYCAALIGIGDLRKAAQTCKFAIHLDPKDKDSYNNLGVCYFQTGDSSQAERNFLKVIELDPKYAVAFFHLGLIKIIENDVAGAKNYFDRAEQAGAKDARMYFNLGLVYEKLGEPVSALREFSIASSMRPEWVEARLKVAEAFAGQGRCEDAAGLIQASPVSDPRFEELIKRCAPAR